VAKSPAEVFALLALLYLIGGIALALESGSCGPLLPTALVLWVLLKVCNELERRGRG
jgi:hypothetical protein